MKQSRFCRLFVFLSFDSIQAAPSLSGLRKSHALSVCKPTVNYLIFLIPTTNIREVYATVTPPPATKHTASYWLCADPVLQIYSIIACYCLLLGACLFR